MTAELPSNYWVRAHPFSKQDNVKRDAHGEWFWKGTNFYDDTLPTAVVNFYHSHTPDGRWADKPLVIGTTSQRRYREDGRYDKIDWFPREKIPADIHSRLMKAIENGTLRASPTVVPDAPHVVREDGRIDDWITCAIAVFDATENRRPANWDAIGVQDLKAYYKAAGLEFPDNVMKGEGNPNHDAAGKFSSGGEGGESDDTPATTQSENIDALKERYGKRTAVVSSEKEDGVIHTQIWHGATSELSDTYSSGGVSFDDKSKAQVWAGASRNPTRQQAADALGQNIGITQSAHDRLWKISRGKTQKADLQGVSMLDLKFLDKVKTWFKSAPMPDDEPEPTDDAPPEMKSDDADKDKANTASMWDELFDQEEAPEGLEEQGGTKPPKAKENDMGQANTDELRLEYETKMKAVFDQNQAMVTQNAELTRRLDEKDMGAWAEAQLRAGKIVPDEFQGVVDFAMQLKQDDTNTHPLMKFADGKTPSRLAMYQASIEARQVVMAPQPKNGEMKGLGFADSHSSKDKPYTQAEIDAQLAKTAVGQQALKLRNKTQQGGN